VQYAYVRNVREQKTGNHDTYKHVVDIHDCVVNSHYWPQC
jgi:hypothetical protein